MSADIDVERQAAGTFRVVVDEGTSSTTHHVTVRRESYDRLSGGKVSEEELVRLSFAFLLEREPKESILSRFDLDVIGRYFPEYPEEMAKAVGS